MQKPSIIKLVLVFLLIVPLALVSRALELVANPETELSGLDALVYFNSTAEFLDKPSGGSPIRDQLANHCSGTPVLTCLEHIEQNRAQILEALPNNPEYWRAFHQLVDGEALELDLPAGYNDAKKSRATLLSAARDWVYIAIAEDTIQSATPRFVRYYKNLRRQMSESSTLLDRMAFAALVGIAHSQFELLMTLHVADDDPVSIRLLADALTPYSQQERSFRQAVQGERRLTQVRIADSEEIDLVTPAGTLEEKKKWLLNLLEIEFDRITDYILEVTERSWSDYWEQDFNQQGKETWKTQNFLTNTRAWYESHVKIARSSEVLIPLLLALSDAHLGLTSPGVPARQAPPFWNWSWVSETQDICLVPTHVAPNTSDYSLERPACVTLISE